MSSQDIPNSQVSFNNDLFSDNSVDDLFSDLPEVFIERLLDLERPPAEPETAENDSCYVLIGNEDFNESNTPTDNSNSNDRSDLDFKDTNDDNDILDLPEIFDSHMNTEERSKMSNPVRDIEVDLGILDVEEALGGEHLYETYKPIEVQSKANENLDSKPLAQHLSMPPSDTQQPRKISLRARTKIQLEPFTLEASKFEELIKNTSARSKLNNIVNDNDDDEDTDFTLSNTQLVDEAMDEISTYQDTQDSLQNTPIISNLRDKSNNNPRNVIDKGKGRATAINMPNNPSLANAASSSRTLDVSNSPLAIPESSTASNLTPSHSQTADSVDDVFDFEKYGLDQLIIPPPRRNRNKEKSKIITFAKRKKGSSKTRPRTTSRVPSRFAEKPSNDIFNFDFSSKPSLKETSASLNDSSHLKSNNTSFENLFNPSDVFDDPIEGYETPAESPQPSSVPMEIINIETDEEMMEDDDDEVPVFRHVRKRRRKIFDSDDDEEITETNDTGFEQAMSDAEETESVFDFPADTPQSPRDHLRIRTENDIVPIVEDEFEYREAKRQRFGIKDLKKSTLKNILPASFFKVNQRKIEEEERLREQKKKEAKAARAAKQLSTSSTGTPTSSSKRYVPEKVTRDTEDVFAAFREDSDQTDEEYEQYQDAFDYTEESDSYAEANPLLSLFDDTVDHNDSPSPSAPIDLTSQSKPSRINQTHPPQVDLTNIASSFSANPSRRDTPLTTGEAIEDNRVTRHRNNEKHPAPRRRQATLKSSIAIVKPANTRVRIPNLIQVKQNPTPSKRRRRLKRTKDDIYIHAPYYRSYRGVGQRNYNNNRGCEDGNNYNQESNILNTKYDKRGMFVNDNLPRRPFDDIYMNTKRQLWYKNDLIYIGNYDITDYLDQRLTQVKLERPKPTIYTLHYFTKQVEKLMDHELRRVIGLKNTVYWHHQLLQPLLSDTPNRASAYLKFKDFYSSLVLFDQVYHWRHIQPRKGSLLIPLFARVFDDLKHMCENDSYNKQHDLEGELPGHDHFYVFVSICLTQWVPLYPYESKLQLAEMFANQIRGLSAMVVKLVEGREFATVPWRAIVKVLLFILDWTCRLHHLGIDKDLWSVAECIKSFMDVLVYIGYDAIRSDTESRVYVIEAWICIIQILSVSDKQVGGYFYNEHIFITQLTDSINRKSRIEELEFEKRKTTRLWAESLSLVLSKHMMLM